MTDYWIFTWFWVLSQFCAKKISAPCWISWAPRCQLFCVQFTPAQSRWLISGGGWGPGWSLIMKTRVREERMPRNRTKKDIIEEETRGDHHLELVRFWWYFQRSGKTWNSSSPIRFCLLKPIKSRRRPGRRRLHVKPMKNKNGSTTCLNTRRSVNRELPGIKASLHNSVSKK